MVVSPEDEGILLEHIKWLVNELNPVPHGGLGIIRAGVGAIGKNVALRDIDKRLRESPPPANIQKYKLGELIPDVMMEYTIRELIDWYKRARREGRL